MEDKEYRVYILKNEGGKHYIGYTENVGVRFEQHNLGLSKWSAKYRPWKLVWTSEALSRKEAYHLEQRLKRQGRGQGFYSLTGLSRGS